MQIAAQGQNSVPTGGFHLRTKAKRLRISAKKVLRSGDRLPAKLPGQGFERRTLLFSGGSVTKGGDLRRGQYSTSPRRNGETEKHAEKTKETQERESTEEAETAEQAGRAVRRLVSSMEALRKSLETARKPVKSEAERPGVQGVKRRQAK